MRHADHTAEPRAPHVIEEELEDTRDSLAATLDELQERLSSRAVIDQVFTYTRSAGADFGSGLADTVRYNPVPTVLTGVGLAWLMASSRTSPRGRYASHEFGPDGDRLRDRARSAGDHLQHGARSMRESARSGTERVREAAHRTGERLHEGRERTGERLERTGARARDLFEEQPLLVGALAVAVGATLGALLPGTEAEDRYLGRASDRARDRTLDSAERKADEIADRVAERVEPGSRHHGAAAATPSAAAAERDSATTGSQYSAAARSPSTPHP